MHLHYTVYSQCHNAKMKVSKKCNILLDNDDNNYHHALN